MQAGNISTGSGAYLMSKTTIKPFGEDFALGNGSDIEFILTLNGLVELRLQIDEILKRKGLM